MSQSRASEQEEAAQRLASQAKSALSALTTQTTRALGDARRDGSATLAAEHTAKVDAAVEKTSLTDYAIGKYDKHYIHEKLALELSPEDLVVSSEPPKYKKLTEVLETLDVLLEEKGIFGELRDLVARKKEELLEVEATFRDSQVNIDEMDHAGFHSASETLKRIVSTSVESIVEKMNLETDAIVVKYRALLEEQARAFESEAVIVDSASPARMRPARSEEDTDPWQMPAESLEINYTSAVLQQYVETEAQLRVTELYEQEWTQERRRDIGQLLPRAERVASEQDVDQCEETSAMLAKLAEISDSKIAKVRETMRDSDEEANTILTELSESIRAIRAAGEEFQAKKREQRERSERDMERLKHFVEAEKVNDTHVRATYDDKQKRGAEWLRDNDALIADRVEKVLKLHEEIVELAASRKVVAEELLDNVQDEERRRSELAEVLSQCDAYEEMLHVSMRNFLLPEGYSGVLAEFADECKTLAQKRFDGHTTTLTGLLNEAAAEAVVTRSTAFVEPRLRVFRYKKRVDDLMAKAALARSMRDFCASTLDPYLPQHEHTEQQLLDVASKIESQIQPLQQRSEEHRAKYEALEPVLEQCGTAKAFADIDALFMQVLDEDEAYVVRASRPPLVTLPLGRRATAAPSEGAATPPPAVADPNTAAAESPAAVTPSPEDAEAVGDGLPHLVRPSSYYPIYMIERASKAHNAVKQFA